MLIRCVNLTVIAAALVLVPCAGCKDDKRPLATRPAIPPGTLTPPPLKAWVILHEEDFGVGSSDNWGSRLTQLELDTYMNNLIKNQTIFGKNAQFTWAPAEIQTVTLMIDDFGPKTQDRRRREQYSAILMNWLALHYNDPNAINIYFAGWIQHPTDSPWEKTVAWTIDPAQVGQGYYTFDRPFILLNDRDWNTGVHVSHLIPDQNHPRRNTKDKPAYFEHEMGHYLLRKTELDGAYHDQTDSWLFYDGQEHFIAWPSNVNTDQEKKDYRHLMKSGVYVPLFPELDPLSEEHGHYRFYDNKWNMP